VAAKVDVKAARGRRGAELPHIPRLLIAAGQALRVGLSFTPPAGTLPGSVFRCAVIQRLNGTIIGGSTFEYRFAPRAVVAKPVKAR
jgi:hypothetical protein